MAHSRAALVTLGVIAGAGVVVGIGLATDAFDSGTKAGEENDPKEDLQLVTQRDREQQTGDSAERAFLDYWSELQFGDWSEATNEFDPRLVRFVGERRLAESLKANPPLYRKSKPKIIQVRERGVNRSSIRYTVRNVSGKAVPNTITFVREDGKWRILYDSLLDEILSAHAQTATQNKVQPGAKQPGREALDAAASAGRLQTRFLEQLEGDNNPDEQSGGAQPGAPAQP